MPSLRAGIVQFFILYPSFSFIGNGRRERERLIDFILGCFHVTQADVGCLVKLFLGQCE